MSEISGDRNGLTNEPSRNEVELARGMADDFARAGEVGWDGAWRSDWRSAASWDNLRSGGRFRRTTVCTLSFKVNHGWVQLNPVVG